LMVPRCGLTFGALAKEVQDDVDMALDKPFNGLGAVASCLLVTRKPSLHRNKAAKMPRVLGECAALERHFTTLGIDAWLRKLRSMMADSSAREFRPSWDGVAQDVSPAASQGTKGATGMANAAGMAETADVKDTVADDFSLATSLGTKGATGGAGASGKAEMADLKATAAEDFSLAASLGTKGANDVADASGMAGSADLKATVADDSPLEGSLHTKAEIADVRADTAEEFHSKPEREPGLQQLQQRRWQDLQLRTEVLEQRWQGMQQRRCWTVM